MAVRARIIRIGNSRGLRLPKKLLEQSGLGDDVELDVHENSIIVRPAHRARAGWEEQFREMAARGDDRVWDDDQAALTSWDDTEWEW
jgi:antitoxin MazE